MISDGYGETLSAYESWLHHRAHQMIQGTTLLPSAEDHDDLVQRGLVAMWKALDSFDEAKGALPAWLTFKADGAMKDALRPRQKDRVALPLEHLPEDAEELLEFPDMLLGITRAYHRGEVARALDSLTPRQLEYVRLRFWEGAGTTELVAHFGYDPSGLWNSKKNGAKIKLRAALAHLSV